MRALGVVDVSSALRVRTSRSTTALPVGRPTGAYVCSSRQHQHNCSQSRPVYWGPRDPCGVRGPPGRSGALRIRFPAHARLGPGGREPSGSWKPQQPKACGPRNPRRASQRPTRRGSSRRWSCRSTSDGPRRARLPDPSAGVLAARPPGCTSPWIASAPTGRFRYTRSHHASGRPGSCALPNSDGLCQGADGVRGLLSGYPTASSTLRCRLGPEGAFPQHAVHEITDAGVPDFDEALRIVPVVRHQAFPQFKDVHPLPHHRWNAERPAGFFRSRQAALPVERRALRQHHPAFP
jgi:hypothetical protein